MVALGDPGDPRGTGNQPVRRLLLAPGGSVLGAENRAGLAEAKGSWAGQAGGTELGWLRRLAGGGLIAPPSRKQNWSASVGVLVLADS